MWIPMANADWAKFFFTEQIYQTFVSGFSFDNIYLGYYCLDSAIAFPIFRPTMEYQNFIVIVEE